MKWRLSRRVKLANARISQEDSDRQMRTARQILRRFDHQPGVILADEVGMGKTFVALAVAVSVIEANRGKQPVIVMVPPGVQNKWPREWTFFSQVCLRGDTEIRATSQSINRGGQFLKLLDDPDPRRQHLIFLTHGALTNSLADPYVRLGIIRRALRRPTLKDQCRVFPRWAYNIIPFRDFRDEKLVARLLEKTPRRWRSVYRRLKGRDLDDDPLPEALYSALYKVDLSELIDALKLLPQRSSSHLKARLQHVTRAVRSALNSLWKECLREVDLRLPLLILDEAHHLKNPQTVLSSLFANKQAEEEAELLRGPLGGVFDRMLFLTATPFQLGHHELINVLQRFEGIRWGKNLDRKGYQKKLHKLETALNVAQTAALRLDRVWGKLTQEDFESGDGGRWWEKPDSLPQPARQALRHIEDVEAKIKTAESLLKPWVVRHARPDRDTRRIHRSGRAILGEMEQDLRGLQVRGSAVLPFLLASRAQAIVAAEGHRYSKQTRAYFSEGLVSSFEAYRETRSRREPDKVMDDVLLEDGGELSEQARWYLDKIDQALSSAFDEVSDGHPKIEATVKRALELWREGEKVLVFCFYRSTGRALRNHISQALERELLHRGAEWLQIDASNQERVRRELDLFGERFFDPDSPVTLLARSTVSEIFSAVEIPDEDRIRGVDVVLRFLRTPSFLVRYLQQGVQDREEGLFKAFSVTDQSGRSLRQRSKHSLSSSMSVFPRSETSC
ncbi:hypothetical protein MYX82_07850 [Acidobacteria bacterium AH-259-D05]|nr:hypothetical protein [Acidobacteria bacterium AH-259-D05]